MMGRVLLTLALLALAGPVWAEQPVECRMAAPLIERDFALPQVNRAITAKQFKILVMEELCILSIFKQTEKLFLLDGLIHIMA